MSRAVLFWLALLFFVAGGTLIYLGVKNSQRFTAGGTERKVTRPAVYKAPKNQEEWLTEYELTDRSERKIGTKDLAGKVHLVSFFFATCPGTCTTQNTHFAALEREFRQDGVKFVAITCDPETDTPEKLRDYAHKFQAPKDSWYFLTGDMLHIQRIANEVYRVALDRKTHIERFILVDGTGKIRGYYSWGKSDQLAELRQDVRTLLADSSAETLAERREKRALEAEQKKREEDEDA